MSPSDTSDDDEVFAIYDRVDQLHREGRFADVDAILEALDVGGSETIVLLAYVSITRPARTELRAREAFVARVRERLTRVDPERVDDLLAGLE